MYKVIKKKDYSIKEWFRKHGDHIILDFGRKVDHELQVELLRDYKWNTTWKNVGKDVPIMRDPKKAREAIVMVLKKAHLMKKKVFVFMSEDKGYDKIVKTLLDDIYASTELKEEIVYERPSIRV